MKTKVKTGARIAVSFRLTPASYDLMTALAEDLNTTQAGTVEAALTLLAKQRHADTAVIQQRIGMLLKASA